MLIDWSECGIKFGFHEDVGFSYGLIELASRVGERFGCCDMIRARTLSWCIDIANLSNSEVNMFLLLSTLLYEDRYITKQALLFQFVAFHQGCEVILALIPALVFFRVTAYWGYVSNSGFGYSGNGNNSGYSSCGLGWWELTWRWAARARTAVHSSADDPSRHTHTSTHHIMHVCIIDVCERLSGCTWTPILMRWLQGFSQSCAAPAQWWKRKILF